jgi:hypothetical protein
VTNHRFWLGETLQDRALHICHGTSIGVSGRRSSARDQRILEQQTGDGTVRARLLCAKDQNVGEVCEKVGNEAELIEALFDSKGGRPQQREKGAKKAGAMV